MHVDIINISKALARYLILKIKINQIPACNIPGETIVTLNISLNCSDYSSSIPMIKAMRVSQRCIPEAFNICAILRTDDEGVSFGMEEGGNSV